jgi:hypothetical protein
MRSCGRRQTAAAACAVLAVSAAGLVAQPSNPEALYVEALARETALRQEIDVAVPAVGTPLLLRVRTLIGAYQDISRLFRASEIADDALWQAARLSDEAFRARGDATDRDTALRLYRRLAAGFPASPFVRQAEPHAARDRSGRGSFDARTIASVLTDSDASRSHGHSPRDAARCASLRLRARA